MGGRVFLVTTISVYVSSLSTSGVRAMVATLPATIGVVAFVNLLASVAARFGMHIVSGPGGHALLNPILWAGFIAVALRYAYLNHRSMERGIRRVAFQIIVLVGYLVISVLATAFVVRST